MMKSATTIFFIAAALYMTPLQAQQSKGVDLAAMQGWDIVVSTDAIPSEKYAAEEFQEFFAEASGIRLSIVSPA